MDRRIQVTRTVIRTVMLVIMSVAVIVATADGFAQSYAGLYDWGLKHGLAGWKAQSFPLLVDVFILVGEIGLFLLALDGHKVQKAFLPWVDMALPFSTAAIGWGVSLYFNVERINTDDVATKVTYGVPPVTAMIGLVILLRTVHRYMVDYDATDSAPKTIPGDLVRQPESPEPVPAAQTAGALPAGEPENAPDVPAERPDEPVPPALATMVESFTTAGENHKAATAVTSEPDPLIAKMMRHEKWDHAVKVYRESIETPGKALSQRDLAAELNMSNRTLAKAAIDYVKRETGITS
jgi:hypothetical protein